MLTLGYLWEEYEKFWFFIMCQIFSIWLGFSGHSLLRANSKNNCKALLGFCPSLLVWLLPASNSKESELMTSLSELKYLYNSKRKKRCEDGLTTTRQNRHYNNE